MTKYLSILRFYHKENTSHLSGGGIFHRTLLFHLTLPITATKTESMTPSSCLKYYSGTATTDRYQLLHQYHKIMAACNLQGERAWWLFYRMTKFFGRTTQWSCSVTIGICRSINDFCLKLLLYSRVSFTQAQARARAQLRAHLISWKWWHNSFVLSGIHFIFRMVTIGISHIPRCYGNLVTMSTTVLCN